MTLSLDERRRYVAQCDPMDPLQANDPRYVPLDEGPSVRGRVSAVDELEQTILLSDRESCQLFTGFPGTGKTTELKRLAYRLQNAKDTPTHVIFIDFEEYIDRYAPISITDLVRVIAYCMDKEATLAEGHDPEAQPGYAKQLWDYMNQTEVAPRAGFQAYGASLMLEIRNNPSFRRRLEDALRSRFQHFLAEAHSVMVQAVVRLSKAPGEANAQRVVVIADGLEKLSPLREEERRTVEAAVENVFLAHHDQLKLPCHAVYTFPLWLRFRTAQLGSSYGREPLILPMVKIREQDGTPNQAGIDKLVHLVGRRVNLDAVFGPDKSSTLLPLIDASGGYPRDVLRLTRSLLMERIELPAKAEHAVIVVDELAQAYADTLLGTYLDVLEHVARTHTLPRDNAGQLALFGWLFERWLILAYRNGKEWYDLHPLVRRAPMVEERLKAKKQA